MSLTVLGGLIVRGLAVGAAWGFFVAGVLLGLFGGALCALFGSCTPMAPLGLLLASGFWGAILGGAGGLLVGSIAAVVISMELVIDESWLRSRHFPALAGLQVAIPCALFLPPIWFHHTSDGGGGLAFSAPWDALFQIMIFKVIPACLAGYFTWRYLKQKQAELERGAARSGSVSFSSDITRAP